MAKSKIIHGARAVLYVGTSVVGIFNSCSYSIQYDISPAYILGASAAAELIYTGMEVIQVQASGYRVMNHGPFAVVDQGTGARLLPRLQEILTYDDLVVSLYDRMEPDPKKGLIASISSVKPQGFSSSVNSRGLQDINVTFQGLRITDEAGENTEDSGAVTLPAD